MKFKHLFTSLVLTSLITTCVSLNAYAANINVVINGNAVPFTENTGYPIVDKNNRTMVPLRVTMETAGFAVGYDTNTSTAIVITEHDRIEIPVGKSFFYNNNKEVQNDTTADIYDNRIYLPIRAVLESADYTVEWDNNTNTVNAYNFDYNSTDFIPYSTSDIDALASNILKGNVVYINGQYYATPEYVKLINNVQVSYLGDINKSIYPLNWNTGPITLDLSDTWVTSDKFYRGIAYDYSLDDTSNLEPVSGYDYKFYVYGFYDSSDIMELIVYPVTEFDEDFLLLDNATQTFNGIRMKKENGTLYFNLEDLKKYNIPY